MSNKMKFKRTRSFHLPFADSLFYTFMMHFSELPEDPEDLCCEQCQDFAAECCGGAGLRGEDVVHCMVGKAMEGEVFVWHGK